MPEVLKTISKDLEVTGDMIATGDGSYSVTLGDIVSDGEFEVLNKEHILFTVTKPMVKKSCI